MNVDDIVRHWSPAALMAAIAFVANQFYAWRKERRIDEDRRAQRAKEEAEREESEEERDNRRYREQVDGIILALERRAKMAEEEAGRAWAMVADLKDQIADLEGQVTRLARRVALAENGGSHK